MNEYLVLKFLHVVGFAYWLGGDLGVFISSYVVTNNTLSAETRVTAAKLLFALDQIPRICMTVMLPLGIHLAWMLNVFNFSSTIMAIVWLLAIAWLAMVIGLHRAQPSKPKALLTTFDFWFRSTLALALVLSGAMALLGLTTAMPYWVAAKLLIFGGLISCGLIVRLKLRAFGPAFAKLAQGKATGGDDAAISTSLAATRPFVVTIWIGLLASAALGLHVI